MWKYLYVGTIRIPSYGLIVIAGIVGCNFIAQLMIKDDVQRMKDFYLLELTAGIGAVMGAKILTILTSFPGGDAGALSWEAFQEAGYSYYGGLAGFLLFSWVLCRVRKIDGTKMAADYLFLLSLLHAIWKVGCLTGGCCYGIPYEGAWSVCYEAGVNKMAGIEVFPVQLLEALVSLLIMLLLLVKRQRNKLGEPVGTYLVLYGGARFFLEYLRYHEDRAILSDGQVYSLVCGWIGTLLIYRKYRRKMINE